ncbi:hypothetical protein PHYBLDRAFT_68548 [Phycomyces blakesleeanus NRRL 1555(-)]|uniref:Nitrogen regulatory protein areA GATA-like domain-containing protein n=1 Tax=Phycomyces blakesleeanus (strain ATCC 8743b / DSM 1359 / FGSC 10004 / NBRC 33097 / NRRL 1555) TaxID=763407 RepID=A0A162Y213_PHYB8|nr:hypothetical protein PHYBLDRAFT_68548 [Phycomyces blakesleeanus NRRL 1555(-)]OAD77955.1 hypothetical protein PHYBLDRAFT_68548 [Phycomyces blakesleeanus NRRL 1555(-)]|eukprot:XP_018295995.1 hypothetical protein PHYBLDRAFT_68548 [Phycomyces blakesleeanus NRRL 1555(-)]
MPKKIAAEDDYERNIRSPEMCVDYLSYHFDEMDLAASWRVMTKQKKDIVNGLRLENASWRTWAKQKNKLKTVSPETLNWLKDSDVTWLYGPLHTVIHDQEDRYSKPKISSTQDTLGLITAPPPLTEQQTNPPVLRPEQSQAESTNTVNQQSQTNPESQPLTPTVAIEGGVAKQPEQQKENGQEKNTRRPLKSALKRVTMSDILKRSASEIHVDTLNSLGPDPSSLSITEANKQLGVFSPSVIATHRQPKLRFNQQVEQCIALSIDEKTARSRSNSQATDSSRLDNTDGQSGGEDPTNSTISGSNGAGAGPGTGGTTTTTTTSSSNGRQRPLFPRSSIKKIAPARLKNSSQSEHETDVSSLSSSASSSSTGHCGGFANIQTANSSRRNSYSSWDDNGDDDGDNLDDDDNNSSSNELMPAILNSTRPIRIQPPEGQAIRWEGQPCVYDVVPPSDMYQNNDDIEEDDDDDDDEEDDDWDTNDEEDNRILHEVVAGPSNLNSHHNQTIIHSSTTSTSTTTTATTTTTTTTAAAAATVQRATTSLPGPQISPKSPPLSEPSHYQTIADPQQANSSPSSYQAVADIHRMDQEQQRTSPSFISQVANWASSLIWSNSPR